MIPTGLLTKSIEEITETDFQCDVINAIQHMRKLEKNDIIFLLGEAYMKNQFTKEQLTALLDKNTSAKYLYRWFKSMILCSQIIENKINVQKMDLLGNHALEILYNLTWKK